MNNIKNLTLSLLLAVTGGASYAQNGLEGIIVEKYYVSNAADASGSIGALPAGSVTYRVFADMLPGYNFQALYGIPGHTLLINTTTSFFNNEDRGNTNPVIGSAFINDNTVALDSWFSAGGAASGHMGILKSEDDGISNLITGDPILLNTDTYAGIPLTTQDGMVAGTPVSVTFVGLDVPSLDVFNATSNVGNSFSTSNGSIAALGGALGPIPSTNKVLIGQFTTDGTFRFALNMQIGTPSGGTQNYVATGAAGAEITIPELTFASTPIAPMAASATVTYCAGATATPLAATASPDCTLNWYTTIGGTASPTAPTPNTSAAGTVTYYVSQTNSAGNEGTTTPIEVIVNPLPATPVISAGGPTSFCTGGSVVLTSSAASGNVWSSTETTASITVNVSGVYTATETDGNGCSATSVPTTVTVNTIPTAAGSVASTSGSTVTFENTSAGATSYVWDFGDATPTSTTTEPSHTYATNGNYVVTLIATNGGCFDTVVFNTTISVGILEAQATGLNGITLYPNPANENATIEINLDQAASLAVNVVDITGKVIMNVFNGSMNSGVNTLKVNVTALPAGIYFTTIVSDNAKKTLKMVVVK